MGTKIIDGILEVTTQGTTNNSVVTKATLDASLAGVGGGSDIIDIDTQYVRITDLDSGIYRLTYEGTKYIYYSGATSSSALDFNPINPIYLYVNKKQAATDGEAYWDWHIFGTRGVGNYVLYLYYGIVKISSGSYSSLDLSSIIRTTNVENNLDTSTHSSTKVLSAYQGYRLDQNKQNKTDNTLTTTDKTIVGAINELNGKVGSGGSGGTASIIIDDLTSL